MHTPVFLDRVLSHIHTPQDRRYIDCTLGEGGHTRAIAGKGLMVLAMDADPQQVRSFRESCTTSECERIVTVHANYRDLENVARSEGYIGCDGVLLDLGLSMRQLTQERGFSYKRPHQPLDMVLDTVAQQGGTTRAADVVNLYNKEQLIRVFEQYGERTDATKIAQSLVRYRTKKNIDLVSDFLEAIGEVVSESDLPVIFQALRVEVNNEYESLRMGIAGAHAVLRTGGVLQVITFHSGEDRIVKLSARKLGFTPVERYIGREQSSLPWERSAVLRVYKK